MSFSRWTRYAIFFTGLILFLIFSFRALTIANRFFAKRIVSYLASTTNSKIVYRQFSGNILYRPKFEDVKIVFSSGDSLLVNRVKFDYSLILQVYPLIMKKDFYLSGVELQEPRYFLTKTSVTGDKTPVNSGKTPDTRNQKPTTAFLRFRIPMSISNGSLHIGDEMAVTGIEGNFILTQNPAKAGLTIASKSLKLEIVQSKWFNKLPTPFSRLLPYFLKVENISGTLAYSPDSLFFEDFGIFSKAENLTLRANLSFLSKVKERSYRVKINNIELGVDYPRIKGSISAKGLVFLTNLRDTNPTVNGNLTINSKNLVINNQPFQEGSLLRIVFQDSVAEYVLSPQFAGPKVPDFKLIGIYRFQQKDYSGLVKFERFDLPSTLIKTFGLVPKSASARALINALGDDFVCNGEMGFQGKIQNSKPEIQNLSLKAFINNSPLDSLLFSGSITGDSLIIDTLLAKNSNHKLFINGIFSLREKELRFNYIFSEFPLDFFLTRLTKQPSEFKLDGRGAFSLLNPHKRGVKAVQFNGTISAAHSKLGTAGFSGLNLNFAISDLFSAKGSLEISAQNIYYRQHQIGDINLLARAPDNYFLFTSTKDTVRSVKISGEIKWNREQKREASIERSEMNEVLPDKGGNSALILSVDSFWIVAFQETLKTIDRFKFQITPKTKQFGLKDFSGVFNDAKIWFDFEKNERARPEIRIGAENLDLVQVLTFLGRKRSFSGIVEKFEFLSSNSNSSKLLFKLKDLTSETLGLALKEIDGSAVLNENLINIEKFRFRKEAEWSELRGSLGYHLDLKNLSKSHLGALRLEVLLNDPGIWVFDFLKGTIDVKAAKVYGQGSIKGTFSNPLIEGRVKLNDGKLYLNFVNTEITNLSAELIFFEKSIVLTKASGETEKGLISGSGTVHFKKPSFFEVETLFYELNFSEIPMKLNPNLLTIVSGQLGIGYKPSRPVLIEGEILVKEGLLTINFGEAVSPTNGAAQSRPNTTYNLKVSGERGIWLRNQNSDIELGIDLIIRNTEDNSAPFISGKLVARQGNFYYLDRNLKILKGVISFNNINVIDPELDLEATLNTRPISARPNEKPNRYRIILRLTGTLSKPVFRFLSDPPDLSEEDIITYLTLNVTTQEISAFRERQILPNLSQRFLNYFENELAKKVRQYIGLDYFQLESGIEEGEKMKVTVGKYIGKDFYISYTHNVAQTTSDVIRIEYYITKQLQLIGERNEEGRYGLKYQFRFRY